jgi:mono/diheme cytochrome c family protein
MRFLKGRKPVLAVVLSMGLSLVAAPQGQPALPGLVRAGDYRLGVAAGGRDAASETGSPGVVAAGPGSVYDVGPFPLLPPELPPGEGREETGAWCSVCHSLRYITMQPALSPEAWQATVRKMIEVHGAAIPEEAAGRIVRYLQERGRAAP